METIFTDGSDGYPVPPEPDPNGGLPPDYVYPSNPGETGWFLSMVAGTPGDSFDQGLNFVGGVVDNATPTAWVTRKAVGLATGYDGADENSTAYFAGEVTGTVISIVFPAGGATKMANSFDDAGKCANWLTKLYNGGCFVAGTVVSVSQLPFSAQRQSSVWSDADWLESNLGVPEAWLLEEAVSTNNSAGKAHSPFAPPRGEGLGMRGSFSSFKPQGSQLLIPIEDVPLGARILTKNLRPWEYDDSLPDPDEATWAKISITMYRTDGGIVDAEMIRPRWWIKSNGIVAGKLLPMNIEELQVQGSALVTSVDPCPEIADGKGNVVTARFCTREVQY